MVTFEDLDYYMPFICLAWFMIASLINIFFIGQRLDIIQNVSRALTKLTEKPSAKYTKASLPFTIAIKNAASSTLASGVELDITCVTDCNVHLCWAVDTNLLARLTLGTVSGNIQDMFRAHSVSFKGPTRLSGATDPHRFPAIPEPGFEVGPPPRRRVPLVVLCTSVAEEHEIVGLVTVVHIKDQYCGDVTSKLNEVIQLQQGEWLPLYKYYHSGETVEDGLCVVCRETQVTRILLPCRHACLCDTCCGLLSEHCPMCRCVVSSSALI